MSGYTGIFASILGAPQTAYGYKEAGAAAATSANTNADIADRNSQAAVDQAEQDSIVQQRQSYIALGQAKAGFGASGVTGDSGSALDVLASSAGNAELARQTIAYKGRMKALGYADQAYLDRREGVTAMQQADQKASGVLMQAFGNAATQGAAAYATNNSSPATDTSGLTADQVSTLGATEPSDI